jgi:APA family basic amino acid/polyamine antiporter
MTKSESTNRQVPIFVREATGLTKQISGLDALGMSLSGMGLLYVFNGVALFPALYPSANPLVGPLVGLLLVLPFAGMYILLSIGMPRAGGDYVFVSRIFKNSGLGFIINFSITLLSISFIGSVSPWITQWSLSPMFYDLYLLNHNVSYLNIATYLQSSTPTFWLSILFIIVAASVAIASSRAAAKVVRYWTFLAFIIAAIFIGVVLSTGSSTFSSNFDKLSASNVTYNQVIAAGQSLGAYNGIPPVFSLSTLYAAALGLLGFLAFWYPAYFAGETRQNRTTQILGQFGGVVIFALVSSLVFVAEYFGEGPKFVQSIALLWITGSTKFPFFFPPMGSTLSVFWTQNPALVVLFNLGFAMTIMAMNISILFTMSRCLFAWSFDRIAPSAFASINSRTGTPINAIVLLTVVAAVYAYFSIYISGLLATLFSYGTAGIFIAFLFVSLAAIFYPYRRKDVFDLSEPAGKFKVGGVPLVSILGGISFVLSLVIVYAIVLPSIGGPFTTIFFEGVIPTFIIGAVLYGVAWAARRKQNIDLSLVAREIPPE